MEKERLAFDRAWRVTKFDVHFAPKHKGHHTLASNVEERGHEYPSDHYFDIIDEQSPGSVRHTDSGTHLTGQSTPRLQDDGSYVGVNLTNQDFTDPSKWDEDVEDFSRIGAHETVHHLIEPEIEEWATEESGYGRGDLSNDVNDPSFWDDLGEAMDREKNKETLRSLGHEFGAFSLTPDSSQPSGFMSVEDRKKHMSGRSYGKIRDYVRGDKPFSDLRPKSEDEFEQAWRVMKADDVPKEGEVCGHEAEFTRRGETGYRIKYCILPKGHPADLAATDEIHIALGGHVYEETGLGEHRDAMEGME